MKEKQQLNTIADTVYLQMSATSTPVEQPMLVILMGLPYSGKSTLGQLMGAHNFIHFWSTIIKKTYDLDNYDMIDLALLLIPRLLDDGYNVVFDFVNHRVSLRRKLAAIANAGRFQHRTIWLDTNLREVISRQKTCVENGGSLGRSIIGVDTIEVVLDELDPPGPEENTMRIKNNDYSMLWQWLDTPLQK